MHGKTRIIVTLFVLMSTMWVGMARSTMPQVKPEITLAKTIAIGIPGAGAVARIGDFLSGPLSGAPWTASGQMLDPNRVLVASTSNFGASVWIDDPGTILSIDPRSSETPLIIPERFAVGGGQATALGGAVRVFTSNNTAFVNSLLNPTAATQLLSAVSVPTGIAIDNAFSHLAFSSSTGIRDGEGWESIVDAQGRPFRGPAAFAGGVFAGTRTNRDPVAGLRGSLIGGSLGTAFMGLSPDGSQQVVFAVANGNGSVAQVHLEMGVDGLILTGVLGPYSGSAQAQESWGAGAVMNTRGGMLFQAEPERLLFICDPGNNGIRVYPIAANRTVFRALSLRHLWQSSVLSSPVDMAPAQLATTGPVSNTTLAPGSDLYVANRGNGTIVRLRQNGDVVAARRIQVDGLGVVGPGFVNGIGLSKDGRSLYVTLTGPITVDDRVLRGLLVSIPVF